jgi:hypothetical protein
MKVSFGAVVLFSAVSAQQITDILDAVKNIMPSDFMQNVQEVAQPVKDALEPFKVHEETRKRGVPHLHDDYGKLLESTQRFFSRLREQLG